MPKHRESNENPWGTNQEKILLCPNTAKAIKTCGEHIKKKHFYAQTPQKERKSARNKSEKGGI
jgi:hypothetical protein